MRKLIFVGFIVIFILCFFVGCENHQYNLFFYLDANEVIESISISEDGINQYSLPIPEKMDTHS